MKTKALNKFNNNFLNNQNYILWRTEKKRLLSKFFVEKILQKVLILFSFFNSLICNKKYSIKSWSFNINFLFIVFSSLLILFIMLLLLPFLDGPYLQNSNFQNFKVSFLYSFIYTYWPIFIISLFHVIKHFEYKEIKDYSEFFYLKKFSFFNLFVLFTISIWLLYFSRVGFLEIFSLKGIFIYSITLVSSLIYVSTKKLNIFNILFLPIIFVIVLITWFISYILTYFTKGSHIYKLYPKTSLLKKFSNISKKYAENKFYKIELK